MEMANKDTIHKIRKITLLLPVKNNNIRKISGTIQIHFNPILIHVRFFS